MPEFSDVWVDVGAKNKEEAEGLVRHGDPVTFALGYRPLVTGIGIIAGYVVLVLGPSFYLRRRIGARRWNGLEGIPDGPCAPDHVVVGPAGGRGRDGVARGHGRAVREEAPERDDQDGAPDDEPER